MSIDDQIEIVSELPSVPVTKQFPVAKVSLKHPEIARANVAVSQEHPDETLKANSNRSVLQQHCDFFDMNRDGILTPRETFYSFRRLGLNWLICIVGVLVIHGTMSFATARMFGFIPFDPYFRIFLDNVHSIKHGSDSGTYDNEGRYIPQKFEELFSKFDKDNKGGLTLWETFAMTEHMRVAMDFYGWFAAKFEWGLTYWLAAQDGILSKEVIRGVYDGSLFHTIALQNAQKHGHKIHDQ